MNNVSNTDTDTKKKSHWSSRILGAWWLQSLYRAVVFIGAVVLAIYLVGLAQRMGWIQTVTVTAPAEMSTSAESSVKYICPMMCTPPSSEPGRCPVCAMELVPASADSGDSDSKSVSIAPADRRLVGIQTVAARRGLLDRTVRAVGILQVDESRLSRIPADTSGRVEKLFVNFAGQQVEKGQSLATLYSPDLFAAQTELLTLKRTRRRSSGRRYTLADVREELISAARERLHELGMSRSQIEAMEARGAADTRVDIRSPQSGTVSKLMLREGQYIKAGDLVYEIADLSTIWLLTELFPEDAALVRYGQRIVASVSSLPGEKLAGRISFIDPMVDTTKRTVRVRVELKNTNGRLRPGDEATVAIQVPARPGQDIYDDELAGQWICPVHPDEIASGPGVCPRSNRARVPTSKFGFANLSSDLEPSILIPRRAVLRAAEESVVYVEVEEGRFELRSLTLGANVGDELIVIDGLKENEQVAIDGNFLIDSQLQLSGKPSLIDPARVEVEEEQEWEIDLPPMELPGAVEIERDTLPPVAKPAAIAPGESGHTHSNGSDRDDVHHSDEEASGAAWQLPPMMPPTRMEGPQSDLDSLSDVMSFSRSEMTTS